MNKRQRKKRAAKQNKAFTNFLIFCYRAVIAAYKMMRRVGLCFTDEQKQIIKDYCDKGEIQKARGVILERLKLLDQEVTCGKIKNKGG